MIQLNEMITIVILFIFCSIDHLEGFSFNRVKRDVSIYDQRNSAIGNLIFDSTVVPTATEHRKIACFFVFDKEASADLNNTLENAKKYADRLAELASLYTAHANIVVTNAGTEIWAYADQISFDVGNDSYSAMPDLVTQFQKYLAIKQEGLFGTVYAVGVLISKNTDKVAGGYSQGPPCTTSGVSLIMYGTYPWSIAGLLAHELAHTLSVVHPFELSYVCEYFSALTFCQSSKLPDECTCITTPEQCLMTFQFGAAKVNAPKYTSCDIEMMNYFSSNIPCLIK